MKKTLALLLFSTVAWAGAGRGQKAPEFSLPSLKGARTSLASLRGKVVVLDFWAQWCEPCKQELPELQKLYKDYSSRGVVIVGVNIDKTRENAERLVSQLGLSFPILLDPTGAVAGVYDLPKMPTSFVIDKNGTIRFVHEGFEGSSDVTKLRGELDALTK